MEGTKNIPKIRFKGYNDEWEKKELGTLIKLNGRIGFRGYTRKDIISKEDGGVLAFSPTNIIGNKLTIKCNNTYITRYKYNESPEIKVYNNDILFVKTGSTLGKSALVNNLNEDATINPQIVVIRAKKCDERFLSASLTTKDVLEQVNAVKIGGAIPTLNEEKIKEIKVMLPKNKEEQKQIGSLFKNLDEKLEIEREKHEKLVNFKKAMLENVFPKEGEKRPKIRFDCYNDDWKLLKLGELGEISSAGVDKVIRPNEKEVYLLNYMDVYKNKQPSNNNIHEFMISSAKEHQILSKNVLKGDIFFTPSSETSDDIGHSMCIYNNVENLVYSYHILRFRPYDNKLDIYFSNYFANIYPVRKQLIVNCQGAQRMTLKMEEFNNLVVAIPSINEQKLIGSFFKSLDEKIQVSEEKIIKIENFKKAMMEAMFV